MAKKKRTVNIRKAIQIAVAQKGYANVAEFGEKSGIGQASISHWMTGYRRPMLANLEKLATELNMPVSELIALGE